MTMTRRQLGTDEAWGRNLEVVERRRPMAARLHCTLAQWAVAWTISQPGVTVALCGAKRADQIQETAEAGSLAETLQREEIDPKVGGDQE